jgi:hypothetical protein
VSKRIFVTLLGAVLAGAVAAGPAQAAAIGYYAAGNSVSAGTQNVVSIACGTGHVLGGGVFSQGSYNSTRINALNLTDGPDADTRANDAIIGYVDGLSGIVISARVACLGGKAGDALKYRTKNTQVKAGKSKTVIANCPDGYKVTGGGEENGGGFGEAALKVSRPVHKGTAWQAGIKNLTPTSLFLQAESICAKGRFAKRLSYSQKTAEVPAGTQDAKAVDCAGNKTEVGGGVSVGDGSFLVNGLGVVTDGSGTLAWVDATGSDPVKFKTYAVCHG